MEKLIDMKPPVKYRGQFLREISMGFERAQALLTAFELGLFTALKISKTSETLAREMGLRPEITGSFLDVLAALGLLCKEKDCYRTAPDLVPFLAEGEPYFSLYLEAAGKERRTWVNLKEALQKGSLREPEKEKFLYTRDSLAWTARDCMHGRLQKTLQLVSALPEFGLSRRLIDLGGGHGLFAIGFAQENPDLEAVVYDRPEITELAREYIEKYGMQSRVSTLSGDYLRDDFGSGYDIVFEALSLEGGPAEAKILYKKAVKALDPGGLFITQLFLLDDSGTSPLAALTLDLKEKITGNMQLHLFTRAELFELFECVGLVGEQVLDISMGPDLPLRMVIARKKWKGNKKEG